MHLPVPLYHRTFWEYIYLHPAAATLKTFLVCEGGGGEK